MLLIVDKEGMVVGETKTAIGAMPKDQNYRFFDKSVYIESVIGEPLKWPRECRNQLLERSDYTEFPSFQKNNQKLSEDWQAYRDELRALTEKYEKPDSVVFPISPEGKQKQGVVNVDTITEAQSNEIMKAAKKKHNGVSMLRKMQITIGHEEHFDRIRKAAFSNKKGQ